MIAKSDVVILSLASLALAASVFRWYQNTHDVDAITIPASVRLSTTAESASTGNASADNGANREARESSSAAVDARSGGNQQAASGADSSTGAAEPEADDPTTDDSAFGVHTVESGEYLGLIANQYGTTVSRLQSLNGLEGTTILVGQELLYPRTD